VLSRKSLLKLAKDLAKDSFQFLLHCVRLHSTLLSALDSPNSLFCRARWGSALM
jgi:hypothetical protein